MASQLKRITVALHGNASSKGSQCVYNNTGISFSIVVLLNVISNTFIKCAQKAENRYATECAKELCSHAIVWKKIKNSDRKTARWTGSTPARPIFDCQMAGVEL